VESQSNFEELLNALAPSLLGCLASVLDGNTPWLHAHEDAAAAADLFLQRSASSGRNITTKHKPTAAATAASSSSSTTANDASLPASSSFAGVFTDSQGQARSSSGESTSGSGRDKVEDCLPPILKEHAKWNDIRKVRSSEI